jgi:hypothetical protein
VEMMLEAAVLQASYVYFPSLMKFKAVESASVRNLGKFSELPRSLKRDHPVDEVARVNFVVMPNAIFEVERQEADLGLNRLSCTSEHFARKNVCFGSTRAVRRSFS